MAEVSEGVTLRTISSGAHLCFGGFRDQIEIVVKNDLILC